MEKRLPAGNLFLRTLIFCSERVIEIGKGCICCQVSLTGALGSDMQMRAQVSVKGPENPDESQRKQTQKMLRLVPPKESLVFPSISTSVDSDDKFFVLFYVALFFLMLVRS